MRDVCMVVKDGKFYWGLNEKGQSLWFPMETGFEAGWRGDPVSALEIATRENATVKKIVLVDL